MQEAAMVCTAAVLLHAVDIVGRILKHQTRAYGQSWNGMARVTQPKTRTPESASLQQTQSYLTYTDTKTELSDRRQAEVEVASGRVGSALAILQETVGRPPRPVNSWHQWHTEGHVSVCVVFG